MAATGRRPGRMPRPEPEMWPGVSWSSSYDLTGSRGSNAVGQGAESDFDDHEAVEQRLEHDLLGKHVVEIVEGEVGPAMYVVDRESRPQRGEHEPEHREREQQAYGDRGEPEQHAASAGRQGFEEPGGVPLGRDRGRNAHRETST